MKRQSAITEMSKYIGDQKFLRLINKIFKVGYIAYSRKNWKIKDSLLQGNLLSLTIANILLNKFDIFVENIIKNETTGNGRKRLKNPKCIKIRQKIINVKKNIK